jgi:hypothetical protein
MTGATMHLAAYGIEDMFLTSNPQITYFKIVYRRHTNFSLEEIRQSFTQTVDFGSKVTVPLGKNGDLIEKIHLVINLPQINQFTDNITQVAWVKNIGYRIIKSINIEINSRTITTHYGEWMLLWNQLFNPLDISKMIGNVDELTSFTNGKDPYTLYIPLQFWFNKSSGNALPIIALGYSDIKVNLELQSLEYCLKVIPTHYIKANADIVNLIPYEYIQQTIDNNIYSGVFLSYDINKRLLYYYLISTNNFKSIPYGSVLTTKYNITGQTSNFIVQPYTQQSQAKIITPQAYSVDLSTIHLGDTYLLVNYIYLDNDERIKFTQSKHDYLIEQVFITEFNEATGPTEKIKINSDHPCKFMCWLVQQSFLYNSLDYENYTDSYQNGKKLIIESTILLNQKERVSLRDSTYFSTVQPYSIIRNDPPIGLNMYSFCLEPNSNQPSGTCNLSKIDTVELQLTLNPILSTNNLGLVRIYTLNTNILRVANGFAGVLFER